MSKNDSTLFDQADRFITAMLENHWDWQLGHQRRFDLFYYFGKLGNLRNKYELMDKNDENHINISRRMIDLLQLTQRFKENPPSARTTLASDTEMVSWLKNSWPLFFGLLILIGVAYGIVDLLLRVKNYI